MSEQHLDPVALLREQVAKNIVPNAWAVDIVLARLATAELERDALRIALASRILRAAFTPADAEHDMECAALDAVGESCRHAPTPTEEPRPAHWRYYKALERVLALADSDEQYRRPTPTEEPEDEETT